MGRHTRDDFFWGGEGKCMYLIVICKTWSEIKPGFFADPGYAFRAIRRFIRIRDLIQLMHGLFSSTERQREKDNIG